MGAFPAYAGHASMYSVHKFMDLSDAEVGYFISQVAMAAASFGVADSDLTAVGTALNGLFGVRCAPNTTVIPAQGPQLQSICTDDTCPLSPNATCSLYTPVMEPANASSTTAGGGSTSATGTSTPATGTTTPAPVPTAGAVTVGVSLLAVAGGFALLLL